MASYKIPSFGERDEILFGRIETKLQLGECKDGKEKEATRDHILLGGHRSFPPENLIIHKI